MSRKGENIYQRKDGRWEARYIKAYDGRGKPRYGYIYEHSYTDARRKLHFMLSELAKPRGCCATSFSSVSELCDDWLSVHRSGIKESTYYKYRSMTEGHIKPYLGKYAINAVSTGLIRDFVNYELEKRGLSPKTVSDVKVVLKAVFGYASENGCAVNCNTNAISIRQEHKTLRVLNDSEQGVLRSLLEADTDGFKLGVLISMDTGIRIGELCALKWDNVSVERRVIHIESTMQRIHNGGCTGGRTRISVTSPKSVNAVRDIPLTQGLCNIMSQFHADSGAYVISGTGKAVEPRTMQNKFKTYAKMCGINNASFHCLRHTFATRCVNRGFEIKSLSEILGHSTVGITLNRYIHPSLEMKRKNMDKLI